MSANTEKTPIMDKKSSQIIPKDLHKLAQIDNIVFDLDGTLLTSDHEISLRTKAFIDWLQGLEKPKKFIFCSGRPWYFIKKYYYQVKPDYPVISCNGSLIYDFKKNEVVFKKTFLPEKVGKIFEILLKYQVVFLVYTTTKMLAFSRKGQKCSWFTYLRSQNKNFSKAEKLPLTFYDYQELTKKELEKLDVVKFLLIKIDSDPKLFQKASSELEKIEDIYLVQSQEKVIDIMSQGSNKGEGLKFLAQNYQLNLDSSIVFGDAKNDLPMFGIAKYSVAMGQADQSLKEVATFITKSNDQDGIPEFLAKCYD
ncbi:5-amino-6-(5-phospho-D-ribitylamino)uracil phosphatase YwtE [Mesomycoplasma hyopneumoniae]|uniref:5-amino-6-(5-phospho-D-ribitylamino)uracil phosphatase YwtE n=1 Tax=Mesomycoplasma hyopneumoniae TaxID=2099 RepID=A0A223MAV5_MESHO|nr:5-amino-6-(5-phospho-D-ribitylamino)uracil phosphatase YwtE [Mesomycoplasma hyopneumoniae]